MSNAAVARSSLTTSLLRYSRSWGLWLLLLVAPVGARYMIPRADGGGMVIAIGRQLPVMTSPFLGISLGIVVTTLLLPVGWMYLRSNTNRRQPWQVEEVTAGSRVAIALGRFAADAAVLLGMLAALTVAGWVLGWIISPVGGLNIFEITFGLWLIAAPALMGLAALRILFDALPITRGGFGDLLYFVTWMGSLIAPVASQGREPSFAANMFDFAGFVRPLQFGAPGGTNDFAIGGINDLLPTRVDLDVMAGLFSPGYIGSRLTWAAIAVAVAALAGLLYRPHRATGRQIVPGRLARLSALGPPPAAVPGAPPAAFAGVPLWGLLVAELRLIAAGRLFKLIAIGVAIYAFSADFRHGGSPAGLLLLIFAMTAQAGRMEARGLLALTGTAATSPWLRRGAFVVAGTLWGLALALPAVVHTPVGQVLYFGAGGGLVIALVASGLALVSRSAFAPRLLLLLVWYGYLSS
jgi:hypothetical protein